MFGPLLLAQQAAPEEINFGMLLLQMIAVLGFVLILIYFLLRKVLPMFVAGSTAVGSSQTVRILERVALDQRRSLLVVRIQEKVYLIGSAEGQISILMELDAEKVASMKERPAWSWRLRGFKAAEHGKTEP